ncbi:DUF6231 family protein [Acinetobacter ursingii]|jgi:hypothetical protein|uniref:Uncharacterized protein n=4 Tax=Acinetobacter TaxID=469 RepID=N9C191_9GAMM|nr:MULTISPECIES: DUF6231 family protein [Acinetobacter]ENV76451.1 hypothetical protein F944_01423 [Acinetobacter ursingii DSM 16037 = CIP 107286]ENV79286.1 hypothetical protein F942_02068 [Acinetobacter ursingii ANC 3649]ENX48677.1 hypothetical protein F943_02210 [Acinetobacter ursingii NIPH 706]EXD37815.1 hypothetical protein J500_0272 [Acinetobacter sp. 479375]MCH2004001.1 DUF6231 family protein [Acinetobacter ursingii]
MAELNVITSMLDDLSSEQPIHTALCIGQNIDQNSAIQWHYFNVNEFLNLPFSQRYDLGFVVFDTALMRDISEIQKSQMLVKLRDLMAKRIVVVSQRQDEKLLRALGFTQLIDKTSHEADFALWQFNILTYKHVPDWFNSKFWANPDNWDKFRW